VCLVGELREIVVVGMEVELRRKIGELIPEEETVDVVTVEVARAGMERGALESAMSLVSSVCCSAMVLRRSASLVSIVCCCASFLELMVAK